MPDLSESTRTATHIAQVFLDIQDLNHLQRTWIPFFQYGGFRIPWHSSRLEWQPEQRVDLMLRLPRESEFVLYLTRIALMDPGNPASGREAFIGLHLTAQDHGLIRHRIECLLNASGHESSVNDR